MRRGVWFSLSARRRKNVMRAMRAASVVLFCLLLSVYSFAQTSNATLGSTVSDTSGALIPGVSITATATGIVNTVTTNEAGAYQFPNLQTGTYKRDCRASGFSDSEAQRRCAWSVAASAVEFRAAGWHRRTNRGRHGWRGYADRDNVIVGGRGASGI